MSGVNGYDNFDGPTSVYIKKKRKPDIIKRYKKKRYEKRKAEIEKNISFHDNHAIEEVCQYVHEHWGFKEADRNSSEYKFMYNQISQDIHGDIELFMYVKEDEDTRMDIEIETTTGCITGGAVGSKAVIKQFDKILRDVFIYYGVMQDDIIEKTERYNNLVRILIDE